MEEEEEEEEVGWLAGQVMFNEKTPPLLLDLSLLLLETLVTFVVQK